MMTMPKHHSFALFPLSLVALVFAVAMPVPARADCCSMIIQRLETIRDAINNASSVNNSGHKTLADQARREATYGAQTNSELLKQQAKVDALRDYPTPSDYACATVTLSQSDQSRRVKGDVALSRLEGVLAGLYTDPNSGNQIYQRRIFNAACKLGAVGNGDSYRHGKSCDTAADPKLKDRDLSLARAVLNDFCIPLDPDRVANEFSNAIRSDSYSSADANSKEAMLAMLLIHRYFRVDQESYPKNDAFTTSMGMYKSTMMSDSLARRYASNDALLKALDYHACYSRSFLPDCQKGDREARQYLNDAGLTADIDLPPSGYCLSQLQIDIAKNLKDAIEQSKYQQGSGALQSIAVSSLENSIIMRTAKREAIDAAASHAIGSKNQDFIAPQSSRPVQTSSAP